MPKIVDHELQREKVAEAAWRVIRKNGMKQASVRNIAEEAGLSVGAMRHYFSSQSELYAYSMKLVSERVTIRIQNIAFTGEPLKDIPIIVQQILPIDEERISEMEVWFAFVAESMSDPSLAELYKQVDDEMRRMFVTIVQALIDHELALADLDCNTEVERFYALVDGLAVHAILRPEVLTKEKIISVLDHHLRSICRH
ncbi:TetR/AcrR family transcriptional regulator [Paenibacillus faecalis]|uniref:TetR/AcrR family transcriptional regulator n=1 Tax=Paenibacillus faecalis TaxID=2079532 RepID=UPI000D10C20D|nr:TetR family transcriptional regulator C-terminal domain-containing protein [Paenibacillus faecalis]